MSSDFRHTTMSEDPFDGTQQFKKNLRRGRKVDSEPEFPVVFENDGFEDEQDEQRPASADKDWQVRSKENQSLDWSNSSKQSGNSHPLVKSNSADTSELREKDVNVDGSENVRRPSKVRFDAESQKISGGNGRPAPQPPNSDNKELLSRVNSAKPSLSSERFRAPRPSLTADLVQRGCLHDPPDLGSLPFSRSQSVRLPSSSRGGHKPRRRLLRELSLSDSDDTDTKDYGSLGKVPLPRRVSESDLPTQSSLRILVSTMQELVDRGKVYQLFVIDLDSSTVLASVPQAQVSPSDAAGMSRSITSCSPTIFKLYVCGENYVCFKHSTNAVQGRSGDLVMVLQKTNTCMIGAFSREDAPGSCQSEVNELARVLEKADW